MGRIVAPPGGGCPPRDRQRAGQVPHQEAARTGPGIGGTAGIRNLDDARFLLRRYSDYYDTKTFKMYLSGNRQQRQWLIMAARELNLMPTTEGSLNIKQNLTETLDGYPGLEHSIPIFPVYDDYVRLFAETGRVYTPTLLVQYGGPWAENYWYQHHDILKDAKLGRWVPRTELMRRGLRRGGGTGNGRQRD